MATVHKILLTGDDKNCVIKSLKL